MISIVVAVRNNVRLAREGLFTLARAVAAARLSVEYILVDDNSDAGQDIAGMFRAFRDQAGAQAKFTTFHFKAHQHYTRALAYAFSAAKGEYILFVSHDMFVPADCILTLLAVAAEDQRIGLVRSVSNYVDCFPEHIVVPPLPIRSIDDVEAFSHDVRESQGLAWVEDRTLVGDAMLIKREVIEKVGVFDPRYFGYFGDHDYGLRAQRAGFKLVCAKGAWLWHVGAGAYKDQAERAGVDFQIIHNKRMEVVHEAYRVFRKKWNTSMPPEFSTIDNIDFAQLRSGPAPEGGEFQPAIVPDPAICEIVRNH